MQTLIDPMWELMDGVDTAISETADSLRRSLRSAIDPPHTSRHARRSALKHELLLTAKEYLEDQREVSTIQRLVASAQWASSLIDTILPDGPEPEVGVDTDGDVLFEWLNGPRDVVTVAVGPNGVVNFASITSAGRFHGVTRLGGAASAPFQACLAQAATTRTF